MKILYKPKMLSVECTRCGCVFLPKRKHLTTMSAQTVLPIATIKDCVVCPICNTKNLANFEKQAKADEERN